MSEIFCAIASCLPIGTPHWIRLLPNSRTALRQYLATPTELFGIDRRPSFSVVRAILSPLPSLPIRFSFGTFTLSKVMMPLARALSPMKWQRRSTSTPSHSVSTTNELIFSVTGSIAMTTSSFAFVPFVHQSLVPFRT